MNTPEKGTPKTNQNAANENDSSEESEAKTALVRDILKKQFKDGDNELFSVFFEQLNDDHVEQYKNSESFRKELDETVNLVIDAQNKKAKEEERNLIEEEVGKIVPVMERIARANKKTLIDYITLGQMILMAKQTIDSEKLDIALTEDIISKRQRQRYVKLVVDPSSYEEFAKLGANPSPEDYAAIKMDQRVLDLTEEKVENFKHASMGKLSEIKLFKPSLATKEKYKEEYGKEGDVFKLIIGGNDKVYQAEQAAEEAKKGSNNATDKKLPTGLSEDALKKTMKKGARELAIDLYNVNTKKGDLEKRVKKLENDMRTLREQHRLEIQEAA